MGLLFPHKQKNISSLRFRGKQWAILSLIKAHIGCNYLEVQLCDYGGGDCAVKRPFVGSTIWTVLLH
jgi:hypothetical protein